MNKFLGKTSLWMFLGLLVTFFTGYCVCQNTQMLNNIFNGTVFFFLVLFEFILIVILSARIMKFRLSTARILFLLYSFISGLTFSCVFVYYNISSIFYVFLIASILFLLFGLLGYFTKLDLAKIRTYLFVALITILACFIVNQFLNNSAFDFGVTVVSLLFFVILTAYDVQKIKKNYDEDVEEKLAIYGAFELYVDYINIFFDLLRLIGKSK